jgi:hypothetical protein
MPLLGNKASQKMNLNTVKKEMFRRVAAISTPPVSLVTSFPDTFNDELDTLSDTAKFKLDPEYTTEIAPAEEFRKPSKRLSEWS